MKHKIARFEKGIEKQNKNCNPSLSSEKDKTTTPTTYWLLYSYPFMTLLDLTFIYDELNRAFNIWLTAKKKNINHV